MASQNGSAAVIERLIVARAEIEAKLQARPRTRKTQLNRPFILYHPDLFRPATCVQCVVQPTQLCRVPCRALGCAREGKGLFC